METEQIVEMTKHYHNYVVTQTMPTAEEFHRCLGRTIYLPKMKIHQYVDSINIILTENAMKPGKTCIRYSIQPTTWKKNEEIWGFLQQFEYDFEKIVEFLEESFVSNECDITQEFNEIGVYTKYEETVKVYRSILDSKRVFTFFNLNQFKPLKELPKKWTIPHVVRAFVNKQIEGLKCDGHYTDDYAFDAAMNCQKGPRDPVLFAKELIESPSGWRAYSQENTVNICCHHFDINSFVPKL